MTQQRNQSKTEQNKPFSNDEVRSTKQDPSPTEPEGLDTAESDEEDTENEEAAGDIDEEEGDEDQEEQIEQGIK